MASMTSRAFRASTAFRASAGVLSIALGLAAASAAPAATSVVAYVFHNHARHVTVDDGAGKTLLSCRAATPTLQAILVLALPPAPGSAAAAGGAAAGTGPPRVSLTLEDQNGLRLWSRQVSVPPGTHSLSFSAKSNSAMEGTRLEFTFSTESPKTASADDTPPPPVVIAIGPDGLFAGVKAGGAEYSVVPGPHGFSIAGHDASGAAQDFHVGGNMNKDGSGVFDLNGTRVPITAVRRGGKKYLSFPWNGHTVFVGPDCDFHFDSGGDLTVSATAK